MLKNYFTSMGSKDTNFQMFSYSEVQLREKSMQSLLIQNKSLATHVFFTLNLC